jgi:nucleoside-diphosphate-sugar epimerase
MKRKKNILVTGATGIIGSALRRYLADRYTIHALTRKPAEFKSHIADIADLAAIIHAFEGMDAVVHLAAATSFMSPWEDILQSNLIGTYNVYEAARRTGVETVVFASSNHTIGMYEIEAAPAIYALDDPRVYDHTVEVRPDSLYGVSKVYGEALGRYYMECHGLRVFCLRIGSVRDDDDPRAPSISKSVPWHPMLVALPAEDRYRRMRATWMSQRDCAELIACCLEADQVRWAIVYGISDNPRQFWDLSHARQILGYNPVDSAPR